LKLWIDECLSPTLVTAANSLGYDVTCNRDRGMLGALDSELYATASVADFTLVTNKRE